MRELRHEVLRDISRVDDAIRTLWADQSPQVMARIDLWLDRRLSLMAHRDRGFVVTDRRRAR